jgi:hypothetical protein
VGVATINALFAVVVGRRPKAHGQQKVLTAATLPTLTVCFQRNSLFTNNESQIANKQ